MRLIVPRNYIPNSGSLLRPATATASAANAKNESLNHSAATAICGRMLKVAYHLKRNLAEVISKTK